MARLHGHSSDVQQVERLRMCSFSFIPKFVAKTQSHSVLDSRFLYSHLSTTLWVIIRKRYSCVQCILSNATSVEHSPLGKHVSISCYLLVSPKTIGRNPFSYWFWGNQPTLQVCMSELSVTSQRKGAVLVEILWEISGYLTAKGS